MLTTSNLIDDVLASVGYQPKPYAAPAITLTDYAPSIYRQYIHTPYQALIDTYLEQVALYVMTEGQAGIGRLMIFVPPRHGKTLKVSRIFPSYMIGKKPDLRLIEVSYGVGLARRNSRAVRNIVNTERFHEHFPNVRLSDDTASAVEWDVAGTGGGMIAAGVGGGITGHGAKLILIDDPVKNRAQAESETYREALQDWYTDDLLTRLEEPGGAIVLMNTRWHTDDLAGWLLKQDDRAEWTVLSLPALAEANDPLGREQGEALWAERYSVDTLLERRAHMGEYSFAALYQQSPLPSGGGLFKTERIKVYDHPPECRDMVRFYDLAVTAKKHSDYTVGLKMGITATEELVILDVYRVQKEFPDVQEAIIQNALIDGTQVRIRLEAEKAGIIGLDYLLRDKRMHPFVIDKKAPEGDKYTRALPFAARVEAGRVGIVKAAWNREYLDELAVFPNGAKDDQVDGSSGAYEMLGHGKPATEALLIDW